MTTESGAGWAPPRPPRPRRTGRIAFWASPVPAADITGRVFEIKHGSSTVHATTSATFVADGLAPPDVRTPLSLILLGSAAVLFVVLLLLAALGVTRWTLRRRRARQEALAFGQVT